jgi:gliding motility-associated-like protein
MRRLIPEYGTRPHAQTWAGRCGVFAFLLLLASLSLPAQIIDENTPQDSTWSAVGPDSVDFVGQDFIAGVKRVRKIGVWLQRLSGTGEVRLAVVKDNGSNAPDLNFILHESALIMPDTGGGWVWDSTFSAVLNTGEKYWIVVDGYNNLVGDGYAAVGTSATSTSSGNPLSYSDDGGLTWTPQTGLPMAIFVEGDNCTFGLSISPIQPLLCPGGEVTFGVPSGYVSYSWTSGQTAASITVPALGIYTVTVVDTANCTATASVLVAQGTVPLSGLQDFFEICEGSPLQLSIPPFYTGYLWSTGSTSNVDTIGESGIYWVSMTSSSNCVTIDTFEVLVRPYADLDLGVDSNLCLGDTIILAADTGYVYYLWSTGSIQNSDTLTETTSAWLQVIDSLGCHTVSDTVQYNFYPVPAVPIIQVLPTGLHSSFANGYEWYFNGQVIVGQTAQDLPDPQPGTYSVVITNAFGCTAQSSPVVVEAAAPGDFVSGGFSPNGDGLNETFFIEGIARFPECRLQVFNRWGDQVYDQQPYANDWDGTGKGGAALPVGDYFYILDFGAGRASERGTVLISR